MPGLWTTDQLDKIGRAEEVDVSSVRRDGKSRKPVTVWAIRHANDVYLRSVRGRNGSWFRGAHEMNQGRIRARGLEADVTFVDAGHDLEGEIDAAYRAKYGRYAGPVLNSVLTSAARSATIKLVPR